MKVEKYSTNTSYGNTNKNPNPVQWKTKVQKYNSKEEKLREIFQGF